MRQPPNAIQSGLFTVIVVISGDCGEFKEKFICMGSWNELLPTDGTHMEMIQRISSAADALSKEEIDILKKIKD